jgi:PQQ-like domain
MAMSQLFPVLAAVLLFAASLRGPVAAEDARPGIAGCTVQVPEGDYVAVTLRVQFPAADGRPAVDWTHLGGLRGGKMRIGDGVGLREPGGWLERTGDRLAGTVRRIDIGGELVLEAIVKSDNTLEGSAQLGDRRGLISGTVEAEAALAARNAVDPRLGWPSTQGPAGQGCAAQPTGAATIDSGDALAALRPVWRCEESDIGLGTGNISRFMNKWGGASTVRTSSGCAGALVAEGRLYLSYYVPAPRDPATPERPLPHYNITEAQALAAMQEQARAEGHPGELPTRAREKIMPCADDILLCVDAATGKTLWKAVAAGRGVNQQHHKGGPFDLSPAVGGGGVFALSGSGWLYAYDAAKGTPRWEVKSEFDHSNALLVAGDVVVAPAAGQWGGYDCATGALRWKAGGGRAMSTLSLWHDNGAPRLIGIIGPKFSRTVGCIDPATGAVLWKHPVAVMTNGRGLGPGGITISGDTLLAYQDDGSGEEKAPKVPTLAAYRIRSEGLQPLWKVTGESAAFGGGHLGCVHQESIPVVVRGKHLLTPDLRVVELATGTVLSTGTGAQPKNGGYMQSIEDLVLVRMDGTHGDHAQYGFHKIGADGSFRALVADEWRPPVGGTTSSYHHPIYHPLVDGRMFLRQADGIYCWDLRAR